MVLERPLSARSVIASLLLGMHPPRMPGARLVQWCGAFGIAEGTARVALSRMVDRDELVAAGGTYELAGPVRARQRAQDWSLTPALTDWDGGWRLAAVRPAARDATDRAALRDAFRRLRYAESREGCWVRPDNLPRASGPATAWKVAEAQCDWWRATPEQDAAALAASLFDPAAWATRAEMLRDHLEAATASLARTRDGHGDRAGDLARAFEVGAAALAHVRADPLLPPPLCAQPWPGAALRDAYAQYQRTFGRAVREWFRAEA
jgi:phenylacetic acid degradation operon negative regulatory protein